MAPFLMVMTAQSAEAQAVERHLPLTPEGHNGALAVPNAVPMDQDATPIGPALQALYLLGPNQATQANLPKGVTVGEKVRFKISSQQIWDIKPYVEKQAF